jgi:hypothetical protein
MHCYTEVAKVRLERELWMYTVQCDGESAQSRFAAWPSKGVRMTTLSNRAHGANGDVDWADLGAAMWDYLTGRGAAINYTFEEMAVEVPRDTGHDAPRATWVLNGTLRITTSDDHSAGAEVPRSA